MSLDELLETAILEKVEQAAEKLVRSREPMDAAQAASYLKVSQASFKRLAPHLPRHPITDRCFVYFADELSEWAKNR